MQGSDFSTDQTEIRLHHPHAEWTKQRLEGYVGTTESLSIEFKSFHALLTEGGKNRNERILEAAKDVAGLANEQGGFLIYGIESAGPDGQRRAVAVEEGFGPENRPVDREWIASGFSS